MFGAASGAKAGAVLSASGLVDGAWEDHFFTQSPFSSHYGSNSFLSLSGPVTASGSTSATGSYQSGVFSGDAIATAALGALHVSADGILTNEPSNLGGSVFEVKSAAVLFDTLNVNSPGVGPGQPGFMNLTIQLDGTNTWTQFASVNTFLRVHIGTSQFYTASVPIANGTHITTTITTPDFAMTYGSVDIQVELYSTMLFCQFCGGPGVLPGVIQGTSDYSHTALLTGAVFEDANHNPVSTTVTGDPGYNYNTFSLAPSSPAVPEPANAVLVAFGAGAILLLQRRRRRHPRGART